MIALDLIYDSAQRNRVLRLFRGRASTNRDSGHVRSASDRPGNTVSPYTFGAASSRFISHALRTRVNPLEIQVSRAMDRIIYWQPIPEQTCTAQFTNGDMSSCLRRRGVLRQDNSQSHKFLPEHKVLLCMQRRVAVPGNDLDSHLRISHKGIRKPSRESIRETPAHASRPICNRCQMVVRRLLFNTASKGFSLVRLFEVPFFT